MMLLVTAVLLNLFSIAISTESTDQVELPTSCLGLADGTYMMKLVDSDAYPIVSVECSNEYMLIDYSTDSNWEDYFTTWYKYHYAVSAPSRNDHSNWKNWFIPSSLQSSDGKFLVSLSCDTCESSSYMQKYTEDSTFYLSALAFGCFNPTRGWPSCDMDFSSYSCKMCHWNDEQSQILWQSRDFRTISEATELGELTGICDFEIRKSDDAVLQTYKQCQNYGGDDEDYNFKPSLGLDGRYCQCYSPNGDEDSSSLTTTTTISVSREQYNDALIKLKLQQKDLKNKILNPLLVKPAADEVHSSDNIVHLTQQDFLKGTYRITAPGTYIIDEDIVFNFNANEYPLANDAFWPTEEQEEYLGAMQARGPYFLGFFAGITIETDDVVLDLNEHTLRMSEEFFFSQPFFSIIELESQAFLPQQGPGFFGADPLFATNTVIKNGVLGLTSHHGVHGNYNENLLIENVVIRDFQTHGIQLNGYTNVELSSVEVGPTTNIAYLNGNYAHLREMLPTLRKMAVKESEKTISFNGREEVEYSMADLLEIVEPLMMRAYNFALEKAKLGTRGDINQIDSSELDDDLSLFINPSGLGYGAVTYGVFMNYPSAGIFGWHVNDAQSSGAVLRDVYIHDLYHKGEEVVGLSQSGRVYCNAFNGPLPLKSLFGGMDRVEEFSQSLYYDDDNDEEVVAQYVGDIVSDIHIAMYEFGRDDFDYWPGIPYYGQKEGLLAWAKGEKPEYITTADSNNILDVYCNNDAMFHPSKGLLGMKISGSSDVTLNGITIENIIDYTELGHDTCGSKDLYHFSQQKPYQIGYSMNMAQALAIDFSDVVIEENGMNINGVYSQTGLAFGISLWFDTQITYQSTVNLINIYAGHGLSDRSTFSYSDRPNKSPEACAIRVYSSSSYQVSNIFDDDTLSEADAINLQCIDGHVGCFGANEVNGDVERFTNLGSYLQANDIENSVQCEATPLSGLLLSSVDELYEETSSIYSYFDESPIFYAIIAFVGLAMLFCAKKIYHDYAYDKLYKTDFKYNLLNNKDQDEESYGTF